MILKKLLLLQEKQESTSVAVPVCAWWCLRRCRLQGSEGSCYQSWWRPWRIPLQLDLTADFAFFSAPSPRPAPPLPAGQSLLPPAPSPVAFLVGQALGPRWSLPEGKPLLLAIDSVLQTQVTLSKVAASPWSTVPQLLLLEPQPLALPAPRSGAT